MHKITTADIVFSVGRGLILAAAIVGATYLLGSWYFGGSDLETVYRTVDDGFAPRIEQANAPADTTATTQ